MRRARSQAAGPPDRGGAGRRCLALLLVTLLAFGVVVVRMVDLQVVSPAAYAAQGAAQRVHTVALPAQRGSIFDRNGAELALSVPQHSVWANPSEIDDHPGTATALAPVLGLHPWTVVAKLAGGDTFVYLSRQRSDEVADQVRALDLEGVYLLSEPKRFWPSGGLARSLLGRVDLDSKGQGGLELQYEDLLAGTPGELLVERGPKGETIPAAANRVEPASRGEDLVLTIDRSLQWSVEQELLRSVQEKGAQGGMAVVMDPRSGEILAMANVAASTEAGKPPVVSAGNAALLDVFEPGSINKVVTLAAALEEDVVEHDEVLDIPPNLEVGGKLYDDDFPHGDIRMTPTDVLRRSSNIGTIMLAQRLGEERVDDYLRRFGLGSPTGLDFPRESEGIRRPVEDWSGTSIGSIPIGQENAVTAVQMLGAFNTLANGGVHVEPTLVRATIDGEGRQHPVERADRRRVVSSEAAGHLSDMMADVVYGDEGTGVNAQVTGYRVAGKTGTAAKPDVDRPGSYEEGAYFASFAGFAPVEDPRLSAIVVLDEPRPDYHGGSVAAPLFSTIAQSALHLLRIPPPQVPAGEGAGPGAPAPPVTAPPRAAPTTD